MVTELLQDRLEAEDCLAVGGRVVSRRVRKVDRRLVGDLINVLDRPRWQDVGGLSRNGGRVIFRSRFPNYVGTLVNHCHILLHEDNGMMHAVEVTSFADQANYEPTERVTSLDAPAEEILEIYLRLDQGARGGRACRW